MLGLVLISLLLHDVAAHPQQVSHHLKDGHQPSSHHFDSNQARRAVDGCQRSFATAGYEASGISRRAETLDRLRGHAVKNTGRDANSIPVYARDFNQTLSTDHHSTKTGLGAHPSDGDLFSGNNTCILQPEVTVGPYWVKGELVRSNIAEDQAGVPLSLELQVIDTNTCQPLENAYVDVWHANATGVYSGVVAFNNGDSGDEANLNRTHNRGIQKTDSSGVVAFTSIFPGHYVGRTSHIHLITTLEPTVRPNSTLSGGHITHVGQVFFDSALIAAVEQTAPYNTNTQRATPNADDDIMANESKGTGVDPVVQYVWVGNTTADGVLAWITIGVNSTAQYDPRAAGTLDGKGRGNGRGGGGSDGSGHKTQSGVLGSLLGSIPG